MTKAGPAVRLDGQGKPLWLVCELTYRCPLQCSWCNNPLEFGSITNELSTDEWKRVLHESRKLGSLQLGFTGGEPALRPDLEELAAAAAADRPGSRMAAHVRSFRVVGARSA